MQSEPHRPPYGWAAATGAVVLAIYLLTLAPTTAFWDTSEYIAAAKVLGIPHPPGNPLFTLMAHVWGLLPLAASYAVRINVFAAVTSAACAALWFLVAERWLETIVPRRGARIAAAVAGTLVGAFSWTVWNQSTVNEKVYTVSMLSIALVAWIIVRWADEPLGARHDRHLVLVAYILALTSTNHLMGILAIPVVAVYILATEPRALLRPAVIAASIGAILVGLSINYIYLPIRAGQYPPINEGEPIGFFSDALYEVLNRAQYGKPSVFDRQTASFIDQLANYWQYWRWQFARDWAAVVPMATAIFTVLGITGLWTLLRRDRRAGLAALLLFGTLTVALIYYLNFKYGFSIYPERTLEREVRERDYFFVASFSFFGVLVALGFGALMQSIVAALRDRGTERSRWAVATSALALALIPLLGNRTTASRAGETLAHDFAVDMLQSVEPYSILITAGDNDTFPLWFAQEVEGVRRDVTLANLSLMNTRWHLKQLQRRATDEFNPLAAAELWRPRPAEGGVQLTDSAARRESLIRWPRPDNPVIALTEEQIADTMLLPDVGAAPGALPPFGNVQLQFANQYLLLQDLMSAVLIRDNIGRRPIYFAWSTGPYADQTLGLAPYLISQGLVRKLNNGPVPVGDSIVISPMLGYVDLPRTTELMWNTYRWESAARARPFGWVDPPSSSILQLYAIVYGGMADLYRERGQTELAVRADSISAAVRTNILGTQQ